MDLRVKWDDLFGRNKDNKKGSGFSLFGENTHFHFHISINPTFYPKEKKEERKDA